MDNEIDRKIDVTTILFLLDQNRQQTQDWTLIGSGANGLGIQKWFRDVNARFTTAPLKALSDQVYNINVYIFENW